MPRDCWTCRHNKADDPAHPEGGSLCEALLQLAFPGPTVWMVEHIGYGSDMPPKNGSRPDCPDWRGLTNQALTA